MTKLKPTGRFVDVAERFTVTQLFGEWNKAPTPENKKNLNEFLQALGTRYKYNWTRHQIAPDGEIIEVIEE